MGSGVRDLFEIIRGLEGCRVLPVSPGTDVWEFERREGVQLSGDLKEFLTLTDGVELYLNRDWPFFIHGLSALRRANPELVFGNYEEDRSWEWFLVANDGNGEYLSIDTNPQRSGRCYDSSLGCHGIVGSCAVVALSFTDLLQRAMRNRGECPWWVRDEWTSLGDAYDG